MHAVGADRNDICLLEKRKNSEGLCPSNLLLATSGYVGLHSVVVVWFSHLCHWQQKPRSPVRCCPWRWSLGGPEGEAELERDLNIPSINL